MAVGTRKILCPEGDAHVPVQLAAAIAVQRAGRKHQAGKGPLGFLLPVGRHGDVADGVLDAIELAERALERIQRAQNGQAASQSPQNPPQNHPCPLLREYHLGRWKAKNKTGQAEAKASATLRNPEWN